MNKLNNSTIKLSLIIILLFIGAAEQRSINKRRLQSSNSKRIGMEEDSFVKFQYEIKQASHNRRRKSIRQDGCKEITITKCTNIEGMKQKFCNTYKSLKC